jgi:pimeloyl-ACP methyl ester carboxylesterase
MTSHLFDEVRKNDGRLEELSRLAIPFLLIWGDVDPYLNIGVAEDFASKVQKARIVRLSAGHWPQLDAPEDVAQAMIQDSLTGS